jgi:ethanolamine permease
MASYALFLCSNLLGVELSFRVSVVVTLGALGRARRLLDERLPHFDLERWALEQRPVVCPRVRAACSPTLPFAVWLFLAIEQLPLAAEESADPEDATCRRRLILGMATLMASALLDVFLNSGSGRWSRQDAGRGLARESSEPLLDGFRVIFGARAAEDARVAAVIGLIASFHTIIYALRPADLLALAAPGYYLDFMSLTSARQGAAHGALSGTVLGLRTMLSVWFLAPREDRGAVIGGTLLNMAVFGAMISYAMQGLSFILLRRNLPDIERPYRSPLGVPRGVVTIVIALVTLYYQLQDPVYRNGVYAVAVFYLVGLAWFALVGRRRLILSPEEEFAMRAAG